MIDLYSAATPNGQKIHIMLEETSLEYRVIWIDIDKGDQFDPAFLQISPNNKVPAIVDHDGPGGEAIALFESGAILLYLADKTGRFLPEDPRQRWETLQWLMWQMGGIGPFLGQVHHFLHFNRGKAPYAEERFSKEAKRLYGVLDRRLEGRDFVVGEYSIADMAILPWAARHPWQGIALSDYPNVKRWYDALAERPAVNRGMEVPAGKPSGWTPPE